MPFCYGVCLTVLWRVIPSFVDDSLNSLSQNSNSLFDVNPFAQGLRMDLQRFFLIVWNSDNGMDKERESGEFMEVGMEGIWFKV